MAAAPPRPRRRRTTSSRRYKNATKDPESADSKRYYRALAKGLEGVARATPGGVLVFFKSYRLLELATAAWEADGGRALLEARKDVFVEDRRLTGDEFDARVRAYREKAATPRGALLLAVMRGRAAEGADFKDDAARCVVVVGRPGRRSPNDAFEMPSS